MDHYEVFISYAWGGESEIIVDELDAALQGKGLTIIRDKRDVGFKGLISGFMEQLGMSKAVIVVISDDYLKSSYCMFELMEIYRNRNFVERIFPIILKDALIFDPISTVSYSKYWQEKKSALKKAIEDLGVDVIAAMIDEYNRQKKICHDFEEVINVLQNVYALSPQSHRESNFQQLYEALIKRQDEDYEYIKRKNNENLLKQLSVSTLRYYNEVTGDKGAYHHLNISEAILAGITHEFETTKSSTASFTTTVKNKNGDEYILQDCLQELWFHEKPHLILLGDGGMGKTVSLIHLWKALLNKKSNNILETIPIFITLNEYNLATEDERVYFISRRIAWHYLGMRMIDDKTTINNLANVFNTASEKPLPSIVLLLDGYNEITVEASDRTQLLSELRALREKGLGVQMVVTSRYEMSFTWAEGFQTLKLQPLDTEKIKNYLVSQQVSYPEDKRLQEILQNPMMLTLYANANEIVEQHKGDKQFAFKPRTTTQGELLWNYLEAQVVKLANIYTTEPHHYYYYKFLIRHFLPYLGYEMEQAGQFEFGENLFPKIINDACKYFYSEEFVDVFPEYRFHFKHFNLKNLEFPEEVARIEQIAIAIHSDLRLMKNGETGYNFLHQNFRDYFAAVHVLNELVKDIHFKRIPEILKDRVLSLYIRRFAGEIAGEPYQAESLDLPKTILMRALDLLRDVFDEERTGYAVWNIVNTWKVTRSHLGGADLSRLNLSGTGLQDTFCYQRNGDIYHSASFDESLISEKDFLPQGHDSFVNSVAFHPDGETFISGARDNTIKAWDLKTGECLATFRGHSGAVSSVVFHPDGKIFISGAIDKTIKAWDLKTRECLATFKGHSKTVFSVAFHPDGKTFISGSQDKTIIAWDLKSGECLATFKGHTNWVLNVAFHPDGKTFISNEATKTLKVWDLNTEKCLTTFRGPDFDITQSVAFHPDGKTFISGSDDNTIKAWDLRTGECLATFFGHDSYISSVAFYVDGKTFISGSDDKTIKVWDLKSGECLATFLGHGGSVQSVTFHPNGKTFISAGGESIKAWDLKTGECLATFLGHDGSVYSLIFHPNGKTFISGTGDHTIKAWDLKSGKCLATFLGHDGSVQSVTFHPNGKTFISAGGESIKAWDLRTGECLATFLGHDRTVHSVSVHPDGKSFISGSWDNTIKIWDLKTKKCLTTFRRFDFGINRMVTFHFGGISISESLYKTWWYKEMGKWMDRLNGNDDDVKSVAFNPDGKTFISVSRDKTIKAWDLNTGKCLAMFKKGHDDDVESVAFNPDGKTFISGSRDKTIKAWNLETKECLATFLGHDRSIKSLAFHPKGKIFISGSGDETIKAWDLKTGECLATMTNISGLYVAGSTFMNLHPKSQLSEEGKNLMRQYGAIFNEEDKKRWNEAVQRMFGVEP